MSQPPIDRPWDGEPPQRPAPSSVFARWVNDHKLLTGFALLVVAAALIVVNGLVSPKTSGDDGVAVDTGDKYGAFVACQDQVLPMLRSPGSAQFASITQSTVTGGGGAWRITSYVDSQNGFGALVRTQWSCDVEHVSGDRYRVAAHVS